VRAVISSSACCLLLAAACGRGEPRAARAGAGDAPAGAEALDVDALRALGYVGFADAEVDPAADPVAVFDQARSMPGYNLFSMRDLARAQLIDATGNVVHEWRHADRHWSHAELLPDGDLLLTGTEQLAGRPPPNPPFIMRLAWDGSVRWKQPLAAHHDQELTPSGRIATLTARWRRIEAVHPTLDVEDHLIAFLDADGELQEEHSLHDLLATRPDLFTLQHVAPTEKGWGTYVDLFHANSLESMRRPELAARDPLYSLDNVVVSIRHQDTIGVFDLRRRRLVWAWGQGEISGPHDASVLENGRFLVFDNGLARGWSRVVELDPLERRIVWQYSADPPTAFFTASRGAAQRLGNGNTLITDSDNGQAFEVTPAGEVVWRFLNPSANEEGKRATLVRTNRYPAEVVEPLLR
jgi:hypothetical protein